MNLGKCRGFFLRYSETFDTYLRSIFSTRHYLYKVLNRHILGFLLLFLTLPFITKADKLGKAFNALNVYNYFEAKALFEKSFKKNKVPAAFGLAQIYFRADNPFHQLDSAYNFILLAEKSYGSLTEKQKLNYKKYQCDYLQIVDLQRNVSSAFFTLAIKENTELAYAKFVEKHPWSMELFTAIHRRDSIAYNEAQALNSSVAFQHFLDKYPESTFFNEAQHTFFLLQYKEFTKSNTLSAFLEFQKKCPANPFVELADDRIYEISALQYDLKSLHAFIKTFPKNRNVGDAWSKIYQLYMIDDSPVRYESFMKEYPEFPYMNDIQEDIEYSKRALLPFKEGSLLGLMDYSGKVVIEPMYESIGLFKDGVAYASKNGKYGYINKGNKPKIDFMYDDASDFEAGRAVVALNGKMGMIDKVGTKIFPCVFEDLGTVAEGLAYGQKDSLYGYYDRNGGLRISEKYEEAYTFFNKLAKVQVNGSQGYIDAFGTYIVPPFYPQMEFFTDSLLVFENEDEFVGLINRKGDIILAPEFGEIGQLKFKRSLVIRDELIGYINEKGQQVILPKFEMYPNYQSKGSFNNGKAIVKSSGKFGVIDEFGKWVLLPVFHELGESADCMSFSRGKLWGFVDKKGNEFIKPEYEFAQSFKNGVAIAEKLTLSGVVNLKNQVVVPFNFTSIDHISDSLLLVSSGSKFGIYDIAGKLLVPVNYQQIRILDKDLLILNLSSEIHYFYIPERRIIKKDE